MTTPSLRSREFERILLVKPSAVGDVVHTLPVLAKLRARYPKARIDWLLTPAIAELVGHHPALSNVVLFHRQDFGRLWRSRRAGSRLWELIRNLRRARYDLVIDLHGQFRSALVCLATRAPVRLGFDRPRRSVRATSIRTLPATAYRHGWTGAREGSWVAYTHRIPVPTLDVHAVDRYLWIEPILGLPSGPPDFRVPVPEESDRLIGRKLSARGVSLPSALLVPGTIWETKHWPPERFAEVGRHLARAGYAVVLAGTVRERPRCRAVVAGCPGAVDLCGETSLSGLAALIRRSAVCVTNDSGSMHLAAALGRPVVCVFGPTDPVWVGPYGQPEAVVRASLPCAPCYLRRLSSCPHDHACMRDVSATAVIERLGPALAA